MGVSVTAPHHKGVDGCPLSWGGIWHPCDSLSDTKVIFCQFGEKTWQWLEFLEKIFHFRYLSQKLSLILPQKGKMLWCSYFWSFIKLTIFSRMEWICSLQNWILLVLLGKFKFPQRIVWGTIYGLYKSTWVHNDFLFMPKCQFLTIWWKSLTVARIFRNNIWFSVPILKIKFEPHLPGRNASLNWQFFLEWEISSQNWILSALLGKLKFPRE